MLALQNGGNGGNGGNGATRFGEFLGVIPPELEPVVPLVEDHLKDGLAAAQAVDRGAGVYLTATWAAPEALVAASVDWSYLTSSLVDDNGNALVLDVAGQSTAPGSPVEIWDSKSSDNGNQLWTYVNGLYLVGQQSGLYLEVASGDDGAQVQINEFTGALNQQWSICGDGLIRSLLNGNVLDVAGGSNAPGTPVIAYPPKYPPIDGASGAKTNQVWQNDFSPTLDCNSLVTVITNNTPNALLITGVPDDETGVLYQYSGVEPGELLTFPAGSAAVFVTEYKGDNQITFNVYDLNASNQDPVASFESHQHFCMYEGGEAWADTISYSGPYFLNTQSSDWYDGSYGYSLPGIIVSSVDLKSTV